MNSIIKNTSFIILCIFVAQGCIIQNTKKENCEQIEVTIKEKMKEAERTSFFTTPAERSFISKEVWDEYLHVAK